MIELAGMVLEMDHRNSEGSSNNFEANEFLISPRDIFLHFIDHEFLSLTYLDKAPTNSVLQQMRRAMVVALLVAENHVYMPASAYFESDHARNLFHCFPNFRQFGILRLVGSAFSVGDFVETKRSRYSKDHNRYPRYFNDREVRRLLSGDTNWLRRSRSATHDIRIGWSLSVSKQEKIWDSLARRHGMLSIAKLETNLLALPGKLGNAAFIADYVLPLLQLSNLSSQDNNEINAFITQQYIHSYLNELDAFCLVDLPFADSMSVLGDLRRCISYRKLLHLWKLLGIDGFLFRASDDELISLRIAEAWPMFIHQYCWWCSQQMEITNQKRIHLRPSFRDPVEDLDGLIRRVEAIVGLPESLNVLDGSSQGRFIVSQHIPKKLITPSSGNIDIRIEDSLSVTNDNVQPEPMSDNREMSILPNRKVEMLFAYSQKDEALRKRLEKHLSELERQHRVIWCNRDISPGQERAKELKKGLDTAHIILLLVSADFLASNYCYQQQMQRALERHESGETRVIPIILRPSDWKRTPLGKLEVLPLNGKAVTTWKKIDEALLDVTIGIRKSVEQIQQNIYC
jgi:TIR domain